MSKTKILIGVVVVVVIAVLVLWQMGLISGFASANEYKAIFLTNGQVYFGKIRNEQSQLVTLTDVFYLQVQQAVQPREGVSQPSQNVSLIKLGGELHAPQDEMRINRDQVLFVETLKPDSQVVQRINEFKAAQAK